MWIRIAFSITLAAVLNVTHSVQAEDWRQFRGGPAMSVIQSSQFSKVWKEAPTPAWRTSLDGSGWSQPIVVGDRLYITSAVTADGDKPKGMMGGVMHPSTMGKGIKPQQPIEWRLICLSLASGEVLWQQPVARAIPSYGRHVSNTFATETPAASDKAVYAYFGAAGVLAAFDFDGQQLWSRSLGPQKMSNEFGTGSSVVLAGDQLLIQMYNDDSAALISLDANSGKQQWRAERDKGSAWSTPILWNNQGSAEVVTAGQGSVIAYDLALGQERWRVGGLDTSFSCSIVADDKAVYFGTASPGSQAPIYAVAAGHTGDLSLGKGAKTNRAVMWSGIKSGAGMPSPVVVGDYLYFFGSTATCYEKSTGKEVYRKRMPGGTLVAGCPVVSGDKIYMVNEAGQILILAAGPEFNLLAELSTGNRDEVYWSTPVIVGDSFLVRSSDAVYCYR
jgi:outer membrane protein assembly factor BamB